MRLARKPKVEPVVHMVTTAPMSVAQDTDMRLRRYLVTMAVRTTCFLLAVVVEGWLRWVFIAGAAILPYIAVVLANAVGPRWGSRISGADKYESVTQGALGSPSAPASAASGGVISHDAHVHSQAH